MDPESAIYHANSSPQTPDRSFSSSLRQEQSHEAYHDNASGSLITSTRPPSNFDHPSFQSNPPTYLPAVDTKRPSSCGNDHNIWGDNDRNNTNSTRSRSSKSHNSYSGSPLASEDGDNEQPISPGQYFGARSLPLESMDELWQPPIPLSSASRSGTQRSSSAHSLIHNDPLWKRFKALPSTLHHRHRWQRHVSDLQSNSEEEASFYSLEPSDSPLTLEQAHDTPMTLTNHHNDLTLSYSFFSAHGNVAFDRQAGALHPGHTTSIRLKPVHPLPAGQDEQVVLVLVLGTHQTVHRISILWASHHDHDPCPFCVLESLYPLEK